MSPLLGIARDGGSSGAKRPQDGRSTPRLNQADSQECAVAWIRTEGLLGGFTPCAGVKDDSGPRGRDAANSGRSRSRLTTWEMEQPADEEVYQVAATWHSSVKRQSHARTPETGRRRLRIRSAVRVPPPHISVLEPQLRRYHRRSVTRAT